MPDTGRSEQEVNDFHKHSDNDNSRLAQHHTLGPGPNQAASGNHIHDGITSKQEITPLKGTTFTGSRAADAWRLQVMAAMVKLGAIDSSTV